MFIHQLVQRRDYFIVLSDFHDITLLAVDMMSMITELEGHWSFTSKLYASFYCFYYICTVAINDISNIDVNKS